MTSIDERIRSCGQQRDINALQELMTTIEEDELINIVKSKINNVNFTSTWNYLLQSFTDTVTCHGKRFKMVQTVLKEMDEKDVPASRCNTIINRLCVEVTKFKSEHLAELCNFCLECIQSKRNSYLMCKDLLPELLHVLTQREKFEFNSTEYTGFEYKTDFINSLCICPWPPNTVTTLAVMFIDVPLTKEEHLKVTNKLGTFIEKMTPQEIPAFIYQLLKLCKRHNGRSIFFRLQNYFRLQIYNNLNMNDNSSSDSNTNSLDIIESANNQDIIEAEATVLYHIHTVASVGHGCIKDYLSSLKKLVKSPEFVLQPFQLMVLFTISAIQYYEEMVFDIIRPCIVRSYHEEQKKKHSYWFREMVSPTCTVEEVFSQVLKFSLEDRELVIQGLVKFGFVLLGIGAGLGRDIIAERQWHLGNMILLKIIKRKRHIALTIMQTLCNNIVIRQNVSQYIECLYILTKTQPLLMLENQSCIVELMESLVQISGSVANQLLDALVPLIKVSPTIRDHLIILLRKALYSRVAETRQIAVNGFLKLLTNLKISNLTALSQSSYSSGSFSSGHSLFTQISINRTTQTAGSSTFSNETLCIEVLNILKRCFMQQMEVRARLYEGFYDAVHMNTELAVPVLDLLWFHFSDYYIIDEEVLPPLNFSKITVTKEVESVLVEPLGKLVYAIGLIISKVVSEEDKENRTVTKFTNILDSLCQRMIKCDLIHFELDDAAELLDIVPSSQQKVHVLKEAMCVYEALIGYKICSWNEHSQNTGQIITSLFQGYTKLLHFCKSSSKPKKGGTKKKKTDANKTTQPTQSNATVKNDAHKSIKQLKPPDTVLSFESLTKMLLLLHEPTVDWTTAAQANVIKVKHEIHQHIMHVALHLVQSVRRHKEVDSRYKKLYYDHVSDIAYIIFKRIIKRLREFMDFDSTTAVLALDCFHAILIVINTLYKSNIAQFLNKVVGNEGEGGIISQLTVVIEIYQKIFEMDEDETSSDDPEMKKLFLVVVNTLSVLASEIPTDPNPLSIQMCDWLKNYSYNKTVLTKAASSFANLLFEMHIKYKASLILLEHMSVRLGDTMGTLTENEENYEKFTIINEGTAHNIFLSLCSTIKSILEDAEAITVRLKSEHTILTYPGIENVERKLENLKTKERGLCCQLCFVVTIMTNLSNLAIHFGNESEAVFKNLILLFSTLILLTRHFTARSSKVNLAFQGARFERLVKLAGKQLAPAIYKSILHIEERQAEDSQSTQGKKKTLDPNALKMKILRETRLIPKVIYEIERFTKCVIQLSNKTKEDLSRYIGQGVSRDFRIIGLKKALKETGAPVNADDTLSSTDTEEGSDQGSNEEVDEEEPGSPAIKRSRR